MYSFTLKFPHHLLLSEATMNVDDDPSAAAAAVLVQAYSSSSVLSGCDEGSLSPWEHTALAECPQLQQLTLPFLPSPPLLTVQFRCSSRLEQQQQPRLLPKGRSFATAQWLPIARCTQARPVVVCVQEEEDRLHQAHTAVPMYSRDIFSSLTRGGMLLID